MFWPNLLKQGNNMAIVKKYPAKVKTISNYIQGVYTLELESLGKAFKFYPGQFLHLALDGYDPSGQWPESRCFSIQSNPDEETIRLTYAVKGKFTMLMEQHLKVDSTLWLKMPFGDLFTQPHNKTNTVFIAGGTGITPFLSLFTHESFNEYVNPKLYLGFRSKEYNIYHEELRRLRNSTKFVKLVFEDVDGLLNIINICTENGAECSYFISGPPAMIKTFKNELTNRGVPANQVLTDNWE
jgi:ferredoxin-NADP reductase